MKHTFKKGVALVVALCAAVGLLLPAAGSADAAAYTFPEFGPTTYLGNHITGDASVRAFIDHTSYGGKDYMIVATYGGYLQILSLSDYLEAGGISGNWIYDIADVNYDVPTGVDCSSDGKIFVAGGTNNIKIYTFGVPGKVVSYELPNKAKASAVSVDTYNNVFVSAYAGSTGYLFRLTPNPNATNGYDLATLYTISDITGTGGLVTGDRATDDYVYAQYGLPDGTTTISKVHYTDGTLAGSASTQSSGYFLSYADGKIWPGHSAELKDGVMAIDTATMTKASVSFKNLSGEPITFTSTNYINGIVTEADENGISLFTISGVGMFQYDAATDTATQISKGGTCLRARPLYTYNGHNYILTMSASGNAYMMAISSGAPSFSLGNLVSDLRSRWTARSMGPGATVNGEKVGPAVYVGGYLTAGVASFDPDAEEPMDHNAFSQGHAQTDAVITYNGKIYAGCYSGGYLAEYDPATGTVRQLIPEGLYGTFYQPRVHALAAGDNKIFFSTVPGTAVDGKDTGLGGCIGWYDLTTDELYCVRNLVQDQIFITLAYDEETNLLYAGSSVYGGSNSSVAATEAVIMVYDVDAKAKLGEFSVRYNVNSNSNVGNPSGFLDYINPNSYYNTYKLHENPPKYISGLTFAPDGKLWGTFYNTVFSCSYNKSANTLTVNYEWSSGNTTSAAYTNTGSDSWFPRNFFFDDSGYMYVVLRTGGLYRLSRSNPSSGATQVSQNVGRIYTIGSDGNIYYAGGYDMWRISLNRVSITEDLIYVADLADQTSVDTALNAYNTLTVDEQKQIGISYQHKLATLGGYECAVKTDGQITYSTMEEAAALAGENATITLLTHCSGNITVQKGITLDLNGKTLTGDVSVVSGAVVDNTNGAGGIKGALNLPQNNPQLPLLDVDTYRLFDYTVETKSAAIPSGIRGQVNFWFDLSFTNARAYSILASSGATNLDISAELYVNDKKLDQVISFDGKLQQWAAEDHTGTDDWALYVAVTGIPLHVKSIEVVPVFSASGVSGSFGSLSKNTEVSINATFGAYPD